MSKKLPADITSYDLLKTFAVVIMVIDHMGVYFFPDDLWWRSVGRIGFPIWFFLVGYSSGRDLPAKLVIGALILTGANFIAGMHVFPLNALVTIALIRVYIDRVMQFCLKTPQILWFASAFMCVLILPSYFVTEYGLQALITAIFGYLVRHREKINNDRLVFQYMIFALFSFVIVQQLSFGFDAAQFAFMLIGTAMVRMALYYFKPQTYPHLTQKITPLGAALIRLCGRHTLEIYVLHLLLFKALAVVLELEGYILFQWHWFQI